MSETRIPWAISWESCDGLSAVDIRVEGPDDPYPALVIIDMVELSSMLADDALALANQLVLAANEAERMMASAGRSNAPSWMAGSGRKRHD